MKKGPNRNSFKYYFVGTQIALVILVSTFAGYQIDKFLNNSKHIITIIFSTLSILGALYALIKDVSKEE